MISILSLLLFSVGDCYSIDKVIENVKIVSVIDDEYKGDYWVPWLYKYVPQFNVPKDRLSKPDVKRVECLKEQK